MPLCHILLLAFPHMTLSCLTWGCVIYGPVVTFIRHAEIVAKTHQLNWIIKSNVLDNLPVIRTSYGMGYYQRHDTLYMTRIPVNMMHFY